ncbi:hypothetical protein BCV70DRAFT_197580 [Testicularia cyperi]|uniref:Uncharacterized protein n=1 Tax=Testicularia cyperi TaxID=1882483 RepID=A0A317XZY2_9BASI|nr:hypothetical protein BCV70DRAFT_197580 [Testicularia cyperi]
MLSTLRMHTHESQLPLEQAVGAIGPHAGPSFHFGGSSSVTGISQPTFSSPGPFQASDSSQSTNAVNGRHPPSSPSNRFSATPTAPLASTLIVTPTSAGSRPPLPEQVFSSPSDQHLYPAATMKAVETTRARFFARNGTASGSSRPGRAHSEARSRPTGTRRPITSHSLSVSAAASGTYRQNFFERCQRAMHQTQASAREARVQAFRKGQDAFTRGMFSDDMDIEEDENTPSSPPMSPTFSSPDIEDGEREEDNELTRRKIIAEYSRLKRIYELKGHLEIGWIDPEQMAWLEQEAKLQSERDGHDSVLSDTSLHGRLPQDPLLWANDEDLEQLWLDSQQQPSHHPPQSDDTLMHVEQDPALATDYFSDDAFEQALADLPY